MLLLIFTSNDKLISTNKIINPLYKIKKLTKQPLQQNNNIVIPKIKLNEKFILGNKKMTPLNHILMAPYGNKPHEKNSNVILMAHSGNKKISYFKNLKLLQINDIIYLNYQQKQYTYIVTNKKIIHPKKIETLNNKNINTLTLITCYKKQRLLIISELKK